MADTVSRANTPQCTDMMSCVCKVLAWYEYALRAKAASLSGMMTHELPLDTCEHTYQLATQCGGPLKYMCSSLADLSLNQQVGCDQFGDICDMLYITGIPLLLAAVDRSVLDYKEYLVLAEFVERERCLLASPYINKAPTLNMIDQHSSQQLLDNMIVIDGIVTSSWLSYHCSRVHRTKYTDWTELATTTVAKARKARGALGGLPGIMALRYSYAANDVDLYRQALKCLTDAIASDSEAFRPEYG